MISRATFIWMLLAIAAGISLFVLKYDVKSMEEELDRINQETLASLEAVHVLKAEWSYLNRPARLEDLGRRLLALEPVSATQSASVADIPMRPVSPAPASDTPIGSADDRETSAFAMGNSPAAGRVPPLLATFSNGSNSSNGRRAQ